MNRQKLIDEVIDVIKDDLRMGEGAALEELLTFIPTQRLIEFLPEDYLSIAEVEELLETTRREIAEQESMLGRSIQSIDPRLHERERKLEQAVIDAHLDAEQNTRKGLQEIVDLAKDTKTALQDLLAPYEGDKS